MAGFSAWCPWRSGSGPRTGRAAGVVVRGNLVPDAYLAAVAISHGALLASNDRGFARFPGLRWFDPASIPR